MMCRQNDGYGGKFLVTDQTSFVKRRHNLLIFVSEYNSFSDNTGIEKQYPTLTENKVKASVGSILMTPVNTNDDVGQLKIEISMGKHVLKQHFSS